MTVDRPPRSPRQIVRLEHGDVGHALGNGHLHLGADAHDLGARGLVERLAEILLEQAEQLRLVARGAVELFSSSSSRGNPFWIRTSW
ncbi:MAG: hypothetical protein WDM94_13585 [Bauldia sp.]